MLLVLEDSHKEHLSFLSQVDVEVVKEFCGISMEFIRKGSNPKIYQRAAQKLGVGADTVQHGVEGLMYLLSESSKLMLNEIDFQDSIVTLGFSEELQASLLEMYMAHRAEIRTILSHMSMDLPHYHSLEWRFGVQLASRGLRHQTVPEVLLKLQVKEGDTTQSHLLQTDPVNLMHLMQVLDAALQEVKSPYCRRIARNIK